MDALLPTAPAGLPWAEALRAKAAEAARAAGLPGRKTEAWMYTPVAKLLGGETWSAGEPGAVDADALPAIEGTDRLVFVDGQFASALSDALPGELTPLAALAESGPVTEHFGRLVDLAAPFAALNTARADDGLALVLPRNAQLERPVHVVHVATAGEGEARQSAPRLLVVAAANSGATIVEEHVTQGAGRTLAAAVTEVVVGPNACVDHLQVFAQGPRAVHVGHLAVEVARDGRFSHRQVSLGGALTRAEVDLVFAGPGAEADLKGLFAPADAQVQDHQLRVRHAVPHCSSSQLYKGVVGGEGRGVFTGLVEVAPKARQTSAEQSNPNLLLTEKARVYTRPQLVIDNDEVVASHGATIGRLDEEAVFYLQSRGIARGDAERLLTAAFAGEVIEALPFEDLRERVRADVNQRLFGAAE